MLTKEGEAAAAAAGATGHAAGPKISLEELLMPVPQSQVRNSSNWNGTTISKERKTPQMTVVPILH